MKRVSLALAAAALISLPAMVLAADQTFTARLTTEAEVPDLETPSDASGKASVTIVDDGTIEYMVSYQDLTGDAVASHIHFGPTGEAGPVMIPLEHGASPFSGSFSEADFVPVEDGPQTYDEALAAIRDGVAYVNIHTQANPAGELRGQLRAAEPPDTAAGSRTSAPASLAVILLFAMAGLGLVLGTRRFARHAR
jgi:hypothetical protein